MWVFVLQVLEVGLCAEQRLHDVLAVDQELLLADGEADQADALDRLAAQQAQLGRGRVHEQILELGHELLVVGLELVLDRVGHGRNRGHDLLEHELALVVGQLVDLLDEHVLQLVEYAVEIVEEYALGRVLGEVDESGAAVRLHARIRLVVQYHDQTGHHFRLILLLKGGRKVCRHLADAVARRIAHARMLQRATQRHR